MHNEHVGAMILKTRTDHKKLHGLINQIRAELQRLKELPNHSSDQLKLLVGQLREHLQEHFKAEENGRWLEDAVCLVPRLAPGFVALEKEHSDILAELDKVTANLQKRPGFPNWTEFSNEFAEFARCLLTHEAREEEILAKGFNEDVALP